MLFGLAFGARADAREIGPEQNLCAEINALPPGEELVLRAGEYEGPCVIRTGGTPTRPLVIRGESPDRRPRIGYRGNRANVFNIAASHVVLRGLAFGPTHPNVDAVRIVAGDDIRVEDCLFEELGGIAVVANSTSSRGLLIRRNQILRSRATAIYIGCHDGARCALDEVLIEGNAIRGVYAPESQIGYGVQIKLNSAAVIRDNVIGDTKGPGIMVYGATVPDRVSVVERNAVTGSRQSAGIVVGGGPAVVRNNVVTDSAEGGIQLEDYGRRGLLRDIAIVHNTVYNNAAGGISVPDTAVLSGVRAVNNAVHAPPGRPAFPPTGGGVLSLGNVDCSLGRCFRDPARRDFSPSSGSPLIGAGVSLAERWMPADDIMGAPRAHRRWVGAFEGSVGPIPGDLNPLPR